ncbi:MAG: bifunctional adenosylcobinamide kinase/adenosylcobinamide-phosphate guanylyltransferase [Actinomycetota bacterium]|nr:bifunctional adenosylcobinamide kinase/adenosylcobinamide-phosphate guanylyltransferase [Actinomycetota bacterium]
MITLVLGGVRSGKSEVAERLAGPGPVTYLATGVVADDDFAARVARHRERRPAVWSTVEEPHAVPEALTRLEGPVLLDALGAWVANGCEPDLDGLVAALTTRSGDTIVVSEEVGLGVHPVTEVGRRFADTLGEANRRVAEVADRCLLVVAGRVVELPGRGEVFIRDTGPPAGGGDGAVLLLHGWTVSADLNWFTTFHELSPAYRVVALDHRGHGRGLRSEQPFSLEECADDAAALLRILGIGPAVVVGFSMGGAIAMLLSHRHPALVAGIVFSGTALEWRENLKDRLVWRGMSVFEVALRNGTGDGLVERVLRDTIEECPALEPYRAWVTGEIHRGYPADLAGAGRALSTYDGRPLAAGVDVPCAVVLPTRDHLVPPAKQRTLARATRARIFEVDGDHLAPFNRGPAFSAAIRQAVDHVMGVP